MLLPPSQPTPPSPDLPWGGALPRRTLHDRIIETLHYLSDEVDLRRVGGLGEAQAAGYIAGRLRRADYAAAVQSFRAGVGARFPILVVVAVGVLAGAMALAVLHVAVTAVAAALLPIAVLLLLGDVEGNQWLRTMFKGKTSQSVVAGRAAAAKSARSRVIVIAPLDSPPQPALQRTGLLLLLATLIVESVGIVGMLVSSAAWWRVIIGVSVIGLIAICLWAMVRRTVPAPLPAIYGAGELATLLMAAEEVGPLQNVEVWMIALGASAVGDESIAALVERYPFAAADTLVINLHAINAGHPVFVTREGLLRERRSDRVLLSLAAGADAADMSINAEPRRLQQLTLAHRFLRLGYPAITISSHSNSSRFTSPDAATIERCVRLVLGILRALDR